MTLRDCIQEYGEEASATEKTSIAWKSFAKELDTLFGGDTLIIEVTEPASVRRWMAEMKIRNNRPATVRTKLSFLNSLCRLAQEGGVQVRFPKRLTMGIKVNNKRTRTLSKKELTVLKDDMPRADWDICIFAMRSGLRSQEIFLLEVADCDFKERTMLIRKTKTGVPREVPMHDDVHRQCLAAARGRRQYAINPKGYDSHQSRLSMAQHWKSDVFRPALKRCGIKDFRWHDWRHQAATTMIDAGANTVAVCSIFGWVDPRNLLRYSNLKMKSLHAAMALA